MLSIFASKHPKTERQHCDITRRAAAEEHLNKMIIEHHLYPLSTGGWRVKGDDWRILLYPNSESRLELVVSFIEGYEHIASTELNLM